MKKLVWIVGATLAVLILFGVGFLAGRQYPAHHFQEIGASPYLYDISSGRVCRMFAPSSPIEDQLSAITFQGKNGKPDEQAPSWLSELSGPSGTVPLCNGK